MEPNYKNWVPIKLIYAMLAGMIGTTLGKFMTPREARYLMFRGSTLLVGIK